MKIVHSIGAKPGPVVGPPRCWWGVPKGTLRDLPRPLRTGDRLVPSCAPGFVLIVDQGEAPVIMKQDPSQECMCLVHVRAPYLGELKQ